MSLSTDVRRNYVIAILTAIVIVLLFLLGGRQDQPIRTITKIKKQVVKEIEYKEAKVKILKQTDIKYKVVYKTKYDTIYAQAPDTCHQYLEELKLTCDSAMKIKDMVIISQDSVICDLKTVNNLDSLAIDSYRQEAKRQRRINIAQKSVIVALFLLTITGIVL